MARLGGASEGSCLERWQQRMADVTERVAPKVGEIAAELKAAAVPTC